MGYWLKVFFVLCLSAASAWGGKRIRVSPGIVVEPESLVCVPTVRYGNEIFRPRDNMPIFSKRKLDKTLSRTSRSKIKQMSVLPFPEKSLRRTL